MRINLNQPAALSESSRSAGQSRANTNSSLPGSSRLGENVLGQDVLGQDQAQLSGTHAQVQLLTAQALQFPEIRQEKVNALRQVVQDGSYRPSSQQVAGAIFDHLFAERAA
jgi:flagellar biosynthesis anti-sigma factor FlgM